MLGNGRLEAMCFDGVKRLCHIRGKLRKKVWINQGDIILIGLRDYQDAKADVILKYSADEARNLKTYGEFPETGMINCWKINFLNTKNSIIFFIIVRIHETVTFVEDGLDEDIEFGDDVSDDDEDDVDNVSKKTEVSLKLKFNLFFLFTNKLIYNFVNIINITSKYFIATFL